MKSDKAGMREHFYIIKVISKYFSDEGLFPQKPEIRE